MPTFRFDCILGGVVRLDCEIGIRFGRTDGSSLRVSYKGRPFNIYGLLIDHENEIVPLSEYLIGFAAEKYASTPAVKFKASPTGKAH